MITCDFEKRGNSGLCEYLSFCIKRQILDGVLAADEKLPSKRALAGHLGVSVITVQNAYWQLISEGYVYSLERKGFFAADISSVPAVTMPPFRQGRARAGYEKSAAAENCADAEKKGAAARAARADNAGGADRAECVSAGAPVKDGDAERRAGIRGRADGFAAQYDSAENGAAAKERGDTETDARREYFADFGSNATSFERFPFSLWSRVMRGILRQSDERLLLSAPPEGVPELRTAVAGYLRSFRNMNVSPAQIVIGAGTESVYGMIVQLLGRRNVYAVENPGYRKIFSVLNLNGARCVPVSIDQQGMLPERLEAAGATVAHVSPLHHFPTGIVMPARRRRELVSWALRREGRYIIEDDYDSEFRFSGKPLPPLQSSDGAGRVIYVNTFSKTLSPSYRISYMVLPGALVPVFRRRFASCACPVSVFEQYALAEFMRQGYYEKHIIRMKNFYRTLRDNLISALKASPVAESARIAEKNAGLHFLLGAKLPVSGRELQSRLRTRGVNIPLLSDFFYRPDDGVFCQDADHTFVLNYSGIGRERVTEAVRRIAEVFAAAM